MEEGCSAKDDDDDYDDSNSRSVSYGVLNFVLSPPHHFQTSERTFYRCTGATAEICSRYGPDMAPIQ